MKTQTFTNANTAFKQAYQCMTDGVVCKLSRDKGVWVVRTSVLDVQGPLGV